MNILLVNNNPVVTKLVTLSAQKTGDELKIVASSDEIDASSYDVLIFDDALFDEELYEQVLAQASCRKKIYMGNRGSERPADFDMIVNKPFLPTDLVDLFINLSAEAAEPIIDEEIDLDDIEEELILDEDELDLDSALESLEDEELELDLDTLDDGLDNIELDIDDKEQEGILDKDELEEVQALLQDDVLADEEVEESSDEAVTDILDDLDLDDEELEDLDLDELALDEENPSIEEEFDESPLELDEVLPDEEVRREQ